MNPYICYNFDSLFMTHKLWAYKLGYTQTLVKYWKLTHGEWLTLSNKHTLFKRLMIELVPMKYFNTLLGVGYRQNAWGWLDHAPFERAFFCSQAKADNFRNMKYIAKIKIVLRSVLTVFQNHFTASGSPVDFVLPTFSLFFRLNRLNLNYFL